MLFFEGMAENHESPAMPGLYLSASQQFEDERVS